MATVSPTSASCPAEPHTGQGAYLKFEITSVSDSDAATNKRYVSWKITFQGTPWVQLFKAYAKLGNTVIYDKEPGTTNWSVGTVLTSDTTTFNNDSAGNLTLSFYMKQLFFYGTWSWNKSGYAQEKNETFKFSQLPRYANFTNHTATSEINKITVNYTSDVEYKAQQYSLNGGSWTDTTAGSYNLTGLTPNTSYTIKTKIQRTDSDLWTESDTITIKTKALPTSIAPSDILFNKDGNTFTPSISSVDYLSGWYVIVKDGSTQVRSYSGTQSTTASKTYTLQGSDFTEMLPRHTTTDNWNLTVQYKVISNGTTYTLTDRTFKCTIPEGQYLPTYNTNNLSYAVTDSKTLGLNNNNTNKVIKGVSSVEITSTAASPQGSASMSSYIASSGTRQKSGTTTTAPIKISLDNVDGSSFSVQAVDSRNRSTIATKNYAAFIDYFAPIVDSANIARVDAIGTNINVNIVGRYMNWSGLATSNTIEQVSIKYRIKGATSWTTKTGITFTRNVGNGNFTITGVITGNNFVATNEYELQLTFKDKIRDFIVLANIPVGDSLLWRDLANKRIGIGKKPTQALDVSGNVQCDYLYGKLTPQYFQDAIYGTAGSVNLYDRMYLDCINANRSAFFPGENVSIEHSIDGGSTWTEYTTSQFTVSSRKNLFSMTRAKMLHFGTVTPVTTNHRCRITMKSPGSTWYCSLDRVFMFINTSGHTIKCDIEVSTYGAQTTYTKIISNYSLKGWAGPNMISFGNRSAWGTNSSGHVYNIRITFKITTVNSTYQNNQPGVSDIRFFGPNFWGTANTPRYAGHLYSWDADQNVTFPSIVNASNLRIDGTNVLLKVYPVGSIYISVNNTNPGTLFGGTWEQIKDTFLLSCGSTYEAGSTGGEATVSLQVNNLPPHDHTERLPESFRISANAGSGGYVSDATNPKTPYAGGTYSSSVKTGTTGGGQAHNNMPPYLAVYVWKRIA